MLYGLRNGLVCEELTVLNGWPTTSSAGSTPSFAISQVWVLIAVPGGQWVASIVFVIDKWSHVKLL